MQISIFSLAFRIILIFEIGFIFLSIFLITEKRILSIASGEDFIRFSDYLIQKDIKKVEIVNEHYEKQIEILLHYHGFHDPEKIVLDNYPTAVNLRKQISELREEKYSS